MINLEEAVIRKLKTTQHILCTVESCTGGLISNLITNVSGASEVYWGSIVTYDNSLKLDLGVPAKTLEEQGAVSLDTACEMAEKGLEKMKSTLSTRTSYSLIKPKGLVCLATTGIAGPGGGTEEKPVGLCFIAIAISGKKTLVEEFYAAPHLTRVETKLEFAQKALELIRESF